MHTESITPVDIKPISAKNRINVSHLRREGEMYRIIENFGGIINTQSKEFSNAHATLLETLAQAGEPSSAPPGTKTDKRTAIAALDTLEGRGKIKQLRTSVQTHTGINRPARIAYLPTITESQLKQYLANLSKALQPAPQATSFVKIDERVEYGADPTSISRSSLPLQLLQLEQPGTDKKERWSKNIARANQLFAYDDETIRDVLLAERTTLGQLYGFIVGKMARIRALHILALRAFGSSQPSPNIVSKEHKIIDLSFFCYDISLADYCSLVSCLAHSKELSDIFASEGPRRAVHDLPPHLYSFVQIGRSRARSRFLEMLEVLRLLGVISPLQPSKSEHPRIICEANGHTMSFEDASLEGWTTSTPMIAPSFWKFHDIAPIHIWRESETSPSFWKSLAIDTPSAALQFWDTLHIASIEATCSGNEPANGAQPATSVNVSLARSLRRPGSWNSKYVLTWHQMQYLKQFIDIYSAETPFEEAEDEIREPLIERICRVSSASREAVVAFYGEVRERLLRELNRAKQKGKQTSGVEKRARRAAEVKELLAKKAAEARRKRQQEWDALLLQVHPGPLSSGASSRVKRVEKRFLEAGSTQETEKWKGDIISAIREADMVKMLKITSKQHAIVTPHLIPPPPIVLNPLEPSVESLISKQGSSTGFKGVPKRKRNRGKKKNTGQFIA
jgi:transcription factor C subunit 3